MMQNALCRSVLAGMLMLLLITSTAAQGTDDSWKTTRYLTGKPQYGAVYPTSLPPPEELPGIYPDDPERVVYVACLGTSFWMEIPADGPPAEAYHNKGLLLLLDEQSESYMSEIIRPVSVEMIGDVLLGEAIGFGDEVLQITVTRG